MHILSVVLENRSKKGLHISIYIFNCPRSMYVRASDLRVTHGLKFPVFAFCYAFSGFTLACISAVALRKYYSLISALLHFVAIQLARFGWVLFFFFSAAKRHKYTMQFCFFFLLAATYELPLVLPLARQLLSKLSIASFMHFTKKKKKTKKLEFVA